MVSMATDSSRTGYNWENLVTPIAPSFLIGSSFILAGNKNNHNILDGLKIGNI